LTSRICRNKVGFETNVIRVANRAMVDAHVGATFAKLTRDQAAAKLRAANTAYGFVNDVAAFSRHPALRRQTVETPNGPVAIAAPPVLRGCATRAWAGSGDRRALGGDPRGVRVTSVKSGGPLNRELRLRCDAGMATLLKPKRGAIMAMIPSRPGSMSSRRSSRAAV
jgi:hypothetical protein